MDNTLKFRHYRIRFCKYFDAYQIGVPLYCAGGNLDKQRAEVSYFIAAFVNRTLTEYQPTLA